ncbi:MAG: hypothetical protein PHU88_09480 [candidate division Zixibacteria bacterium]|nr:hypothetical protein [candidate division Zixibacteria bacterium]MDD5425946.1 hypothetical protein [candidate division Zixibacteria bacterium]
MESNLGRVTARLAEKAEDISADLIDLINRNINPPTPVGAGDVHIRTMYIVSDQINSYGGRFPADEHEHLAYLLVDSPVMVGHRKDRLPVGRNFHAVTVAKDNQHWVKSYFYWLRNAQGAGDLKDNIDGGIYKECSIGFTFQFPECSVCGRDIRLCEHEPLQKYKQNGNEITCHFNYRKIERVLETSLVYRGALPDTEISRELKMEKITMNFTGKEPGLKAAGPAEVKRLAGDGRFLIVPHYESLPVRLIREEKGFRTEKDMNGSRIGEIAAIFPLHDVLAPADFAIGETLWGRLVGYRGKERCSLSQLEKYLSKKSSQVSRVVLMLFPHGRVLCRQATAGKTTYEVRVIPFRYVSGYELMAHIPDIMTRSGVEIWPCENGRVATTGYHFRPDSEHTAPAGGYILESSATSPDKRLKIEHEDFKECYLLRQFDLQRLSHGGRFLADKDSRDDTISFMASRCHRGHVDNIRCEGDCLQLTLRGILDGIFNIRAVKLDGQKRFLFYRPVSEK